MDPNAILAASLNAQKAAEYRLTPVDRFWRSLGFRYPGYVEMDDLDADQSYFPGYIGNHVTVKFTFGDRLRILFGGNLAISERIKTDVQVRKSITRSTVSVIAPGWWFT